VLATDTLHISALLHFVLLNFRRWLSELDRVLDLPESPKLLELDNTLRLYISILSRYHGELAVVH
jgi:hypothetical protein